MIQTCTVGSSSTEQWFITRVMTQRRNKVLIEWMARSCKGDMNQTLLTQKTIHGGTEELLLEQLQRPTSNCRSSTAQGNVQDILERLAPEGQPKEEVRRKSRDTRGMLLYQICNCKILYSNITQRECIIVTIGT